MSKVKNECDIEVRRRSRKKERKKGLCLRVIIRGSHTPEMEGGFGSGQRGRRQKGEISICGIPLYKVL